MSEEPLHSLHHAAVPGYRLAFAIALGVMALYLAAVLVSSPGRAGHHHEEHSVESPATPVTPPTTPAHEAH